MSRLFTVASDESLIHWIKSARERLVIVAPGLSKEVATALRSRIATDRGPAVLAVIVDVDPEVYRLGYGDIQSLDLLQPALASRGLSIQYQAGVRIGLVVADAEILVYTPTPRLIEAGSTSEAKPNAIHITEQGAADLARACGAGAGQDNVRSQEVGLEAVSREAIQQTRADLEDVPPRQFDLARRERVFNYKLEYVEFSIEHYKLNTRAVSLPADLLGLSGDLEQRFRNTFRVFEASAPFVFEVPDPVDSKRTVKLSEKWLTDEAARIRKDYFISLGSTSYGNLILKRLKPRFEEEVKKLKYMLELYAERVRAEMFAKIQNTRTELVDALMPRVKADTPQDWLLRSVDGVLSDDALRARLDQEVDVAFQKVGDSFRPTITCLFKGVNYETITGDKRFREAIKDHFGREESMKLFDEHDSAAAQQPRLGL